jgi:hypothetical protein
MISSSQGLYLYTNTEKRTHTNTKHPRGNFTFTFNCKRRFFPTTKSIKLRSTAKTFEQARGCDFIVWLPFSYNYNGPHMTLDNSIKRLSTGWTLPPRPDRIWEPSSLLYSGYQSYFSKSRETEARS